jgi:hypothetical protein
MLLAICSAAISAGGAESAFACRCIEPSPRQAYRSAQSVAYGKVVSVRRDNEGADIIYVLEVAESWKRRVEPQITIHSGTTCSFEANVGEKYVVFLKQYKPDIYDTTMCMGNRPEANARALLNYLEAMNPQK